MPSIRVSAGGCFGSGANSWTSLVLALVLALVLSLLLLLVPGCLEAKSDWPPRLGESYPDLLLIDHEGREFRLSELKGKVLLVEPVGMNCPACNAFAGAQVRGGFNGLRPQQNLESIEKYLPRYAGGVDIGNPDLKVIHLLLYDFNMRQPSVNDAKAWAEHFGLDRQDNIIVAVSKSDLRGKASFAMIPGFQLVDRDFVLRQDATGHRPRHNLFSELLPMIPNLL